MAKLPEGFGVSVRGVLGGDTKEDELAFLRVDTGCLATAGEVAGLPVVGELTGLGVLVEEGTLIG